MIRVIITKLKVFAVWLSDFFTDPAQGLFVSADEEVQKNVCAVISTGTKFTKDNLKQLLHLIRCPPENPAIHNRRSSSCVNHVLYAMFANIRWVHKLGFDLSVKM